MTVVSQTDFEDRAPHTSTPRKMLNLEQVLAIVPVSEVTLWRMERDGRFPRGTFISPNRRVWFEDEIAKWQIEVYGNKRARRKPSRPRSPQARAASKAATTAREGNAKNPKIENA